MLKTLILTVCIGATLASAGTASAQYYDPYSRSQPRYDNDDDDDDRLAPPSRWKYERRPRYGYDERPAYRPRRFGDACVTSRGTCESNPSPIGSSCGCYFDGFGSKRGIVQ